MISDYGKANIEYFFEKPEEIPLKTLDQIRNLIREGSGVGTSWVKENLRDAFLIGYAEHEGKIIRTSTHKYPKEEYRKKIEYVTGLDLAGYLERGYTAVRPEYRDLCIGRRLTRGPIEKSQIKIGQGAKPRKRKTNLWKSTPRV